MKGKIIVILLFLGGLSTEAFARKNRIEWSRINPQEWTNFERWKVERFLQDRDGPLWRSGEVMGQVVACVGECFIVREKEHGHRVFFRSMIKEGDDLETKEGSFLWVFLMDGTLVRLSSETSLTLNEINIGKKAIFYHARLNRGNLLWYSRSPFPYKERDLRETDALFLPLRYLEANTFVEEDDSHSLALKKYKRGNALIEENNSFAKGKTHFLYLSLSNGAVFLKDTNGEFLHLEHAKTYLKMKTDDLFFQEGKREGEGQFFYKRPGVTNEFSLAENTWYEVSEDGRQISIFDHGEIFKMAEYLTTRIPTLIVARELLLKNRSPFIFDASMERKGLADQGYRLWSGMEGPNGEMHLRMEFLKEYGRKKGMPLSRGNQARALSPEELQQRHRAYNRAALDYYARTRKVPVTTGRKKGEKILNSEKKKFWKMLHSNGIF